MATSGGCGCPPTGTVPSTAGIHHVILNVRELARSRAFYAALMPRLGYAGSTDVGPDGAGWFSAAGSFWIRPAAADRADATFSKDAIGLCEVAFRAGSREQVDALAHDVAAWGGRVLHAPREYPQYVAGYYAVFFTDPDGIKLELVHIPG